jgi:uncharacterized protein (DUF1778 family)
MGDAFTSIRMNPEIKKLLNELAEQEHRSLSNFILHATLTYVKEHYNEVINYKVKEK